MPLFGRQRFRNRGGVTQRRFPSAPQHGYLLDYHNATFTRSTEAAFQDPREGWAFQGSTSGSNWKGANEPRIFDDGAILIEGSRTNTLLFSTVEAHWANFAAGSVVTGSAPDGTVDYVASLVSGSAAVSYEVYIPASGTQGVSTTLSAFHKADTSKGWRWYYRGGSTVYQPTAATSSADWQRAQITVTDFDNRMGWANGADGDTHPMYLYGMQLESGSFASSYIRTNGAAASRGGDSLVFSENDYNNSALANGFELDVWFMFDSGQCDSTNFVLLNRNNSDLLRFSAGGATLKLNCNQGTPSETTFSLTYSALQKITIRVDFRDRTITVSGATTGNGTQTFTGDWGTGGQLNIGRDWFTSTNQPFAIVSRLRKV